MKSVIYISLAAFALSFAACNNNEDSPVSNDPVPAQVSATVNKMNTRAVTPNNQWEGNEAIGITAKVGKDIYNNYVNVKYTNSIGAKSIFTNTGTSQIYFKDLQTVSFSAYYPHQEGNEQPTIEKTTSATEQTDFLFTTGATARKTTPNVQFTGANEFKHVMSKLSFTFKKGAGLENLSQMQAFRIMDLKMSGTFNTSTGVAAIKNDAKAETFTVTRLSLGTVETYSKSVLLFPQPTQKFKLEVVINNQVFNAEMTVPNSKLNAGTNYSYIVTINKTGLSVTNASIASWANGGSQDVNAK